MKMESKSHINSSSLIDLKAELYRKQEEFQKQKLASGTYIKGKTQEKPKPDLFSRKNKGVLERAQRDYEEKVEEEDVHAKSRRALEAKAKLYEKISSSSEIPEEDGSGLYLVDFQKKAIDNIVAERDREREEPPRVAGCAEREETISEDILAPADPQEEWVDYVDSLGRSRRCMKKDLPHLVQQDKEMAKVRGEMPSLPADEKKDGGSQVSGEGPSLMSSDMHRELLREKWEREQQEALGNSTIHYSNVQFDEIRTHGVGFYQFDKSDAKRQEQMDTLNKLREQTVDERSRRERLKEKRKAVLDARLAKVKQRRKLKEGANLSDNAGGGKEENEIGPRLEEMLAEARRQSDQQQEEEKVAEPLTRDENWRKDAPVRDWDKGKEQRQVFSAERYMSERRAERVSEFAPPSMYYDTPPAESRVKCEDRNKQEPQRQHPSAGESTTAAPANIDIGSIPLPQDKPESGSGSHHPAVPPNPSVPPVPLPSVSMPLPDMSMPPPGYQPTPWTHTAPTYPGYPAAGYGAPVPNMSTPGVLPPAQANLYHQPQPSAQPSTQSVSQTFAASHSAAQGGYQQAVPGKVTASRTGEEKPRVYIPRTAVVDTRLVQNEETDVMNTDTPEVTAEPYKPGSFTAALRAQHQMAEDAATASRERAHFKGGPVMYKQEPQEESDPPQSETAEGEPTVTQAKTEDELAAFLKEIRNTV